MVVTLDTLEGAVRASFSDETSARPSEYSPPSWSEESPSFGHCAVVALVVQDYFGGKIWEAKIPADWVPLVGFQGHVWNMVEDRLIDLTKSQFSKFPDFHQKLVSGSLGTKPRTTNRKKMLSNDYLVANYKLFSKRVGVRLKT